MEFGMRIFVNYVKHKEIFINCFLYLDRKH